MSVAIKGIFENGQVILVEPAPTKKMVEVTVTFPDEEQPNLLKKIKYLLAASQAK